MTHASPPTLETALMVIDGEDVAAGEGDWLETRDPPPVAYWRASRGAGRRTSTPRYGRRAEPSRRGERWPPATAAGCCSRSPTASRQRWRN
jgi:hypothetical protein